MEFMSALGSQASAADAYRPSLFELDAQQKLRDLLQPAVQYILAIYAQRYPRFLIRVVNNHEEFYALVMLLIERHYLKEWGASFAENFYGLKRVSSSYLDSKFSSSTSTTPPLTRQEINKSLLVLVGLPYLKSKLDLFYNQVSGGSSVLGHSEQEERERDELHDPSTRPSRKLAIRLVRLFRKIYPFVNALYHVAHLLYNIGYLFGKTRYYTPWLHLVGLEIRRMSMADYRAYYDKMAAAAHTASSSDKGSFLQSILRGSFNLFGKLIEFLKVLLPMSIFFYKFLEWWYSSEFSRSGFLSNGGDGNNTIPPPEKVKPDPRGTPVPSTANTCPLCLTHPINNPTALPSGYVFCYTCAYRYIEEHKRCPVTWIKIDRGTEDLTKVYANSSSI